MRISDWSSDVCSSDLSEGAIKLKELVKLCRSKSMPAVAVTDTCNMFGALEFAMAAADAGIQPITGTVLPVARPGAPNTVARHGQSPTPDQLVLLVHRADGYANLLDLPSKDRTSNRLHSRH